MARPNFHRTQPHRHPQHHRWSLCECCGRQTPRGPYCSRECRLQWDRAAQERAVLERDRGVCANCGRDCLAIENRLGQVYAELLLTGDKTGADHDLTRWKIQRHLPLNLTRFWAIDHIKPVWSGGGMVGLAGLQTLCLGCHADKTAIEARERAERRRGAQC